MAKNYSNENNKNRSGALNTEYICGELRIPFRKQLDREESFPIRCDTAGSSRQNLPLSVARQMGQLFLHKGFAVHILKEKGV